jgi:hypothetical protein
MDSNITWKELGMGSKVPGLDETKIIANFTS